VCTLNGWVVTQAFINPPETSRYLHYNGIHLHLNQGPTPHPALKYFNPPFLHPRHRVTISLFIASGNYQLFIPETNENALYVERRAYEHSGTVIYFETEQGYGRFFANSSENHTWPIPEILGISPGGTTDTEDCNYIIVLRGQHQCTQRYKVRTPVTRHTWRTVRNVDSAHTQCVSEDWHQPVASYTVDECRQLGRYSIINTSIIISSVKLVRVESTRV
jgi:hypothetical protein